MDLYYNMLKLGKKKKLFWNLKQFSFLIEEFFKFLDFLLKCSMFHTSDYSIHIYFTLWQAWTPAWHPLPSRACRTASSTDHCCHWARPWVEVRLQRPRPQPRRTGLQQQSQDDLRQQRPLVTNNSYDSVVLNRRTSMRLQILYFMITI